jgi:hypothetical protein
MSAKHKDQVVLDVDGVTVKIDNKENSSEVELFDEDQQLISGRRYKWSLETDEQRWKRMHTDIATDIQNWRN